MTSSTGATPALLAEMNAGLVAFTPALEAKAAEAEAALVNVDKEKRKYPIITRHPSRISGNPTNEHKHMESFGQGCRHSRRMSVVRAGIALTTCFVLSALQVGDERP